jgi:hypothetical protein
VSTLPGETDKENKRLERKRERYMKYDQAIKLLKEGMDGLIIYQKHYPTYWTFILLNFIKSGRPFSIYSDRQEPLIGKTGHQWRP